MNDFDDLDEVLGPLRSAATPAELAQQNATVDLMVNAHRTSEGKHMFTSRRARVATLIAAGILGFGGMAAASPSLLGEEPAEQEPADVDIDEGPVEPIDEPIVDGPIVPIVDEPIVPIVVEPVEPVVEPVEPVVEPVEPVVEPAEQPVADEPIQDTPTGEVALFDDPATAFDERTCLPGNHGATVSAVARGEFPSDVSVTDAAQSSCGKTVKVDVDDPTPTPETEAETEVQTDTAPPSATERPGGRDKGAAAAAQGKSNGNGNGNSNGKSNGGGAGKGPSEQRGG